MSIILIVPRYQSWLFAGMILFIVSLVGCTPVHAADITNATVIVPANIDQVLPPSAELWVSKTSDDVSNLLSDFGVHIAASAIVGIVFTYLLSFPVARDLRKLIPDNWQTGWMGYVLKHIAREINPLTPTQIKASLNNAAAKKCTSAAGIIATDATPESPTNHEN
jgi:hypothetical protein